MRHYFFHAKVILQTATPYRSDALSLDAPFIYRYPVATAMRERLIKHLVLHELVPLSLSVRVKGDLSPTFKTVDAAVIERESSKRAFVDAVLGSEVVRQSLIRATMEKLRELRAQWPGLDTKELPKAICQVARIEDVDELVGARARAAAAAGPRSAACAVDEAVAYACGSHS